MEDRVDRMERVLVGTSSNRPQDFATIDMEEAVPGFTDASNADPLDGWHCCMICHGEVKRLEYPDPLKRPGKHFRPLPKCKCLIDAEKERMAWVERLERKRRLQRTYARNIMAAAIIEARLDNFTVREGTKTAYDKSREFVDTFDQRKTGLFLFGPVGNGKSHLARGIEWELDRRGWATSFLDWPQLVELAKATFSNANNVTVADYVRAALDADLLVLDEIGAGFLTDWEFKNLLFPILNGRSGKLTVFTSNLDPDRLANWFASDKEGRPLDEDGRLIDRIIGGCEIVRNKATSKRREDATRRIQG